MLDIIIFKIIIYFYIKYLLFEIFIMIINYYVIYVSYAFELYAFNI